MRPRVPGRGWLRASRGYDRRVLLRQETENGVHIVAVIGFVGDDDVDRLVSAVQVALDREPRGVVVDLADAAVTSEAPPALRRLSALAAGWPRASVAICSSVPEVVALAGDTVYADRTEALRRIDDRSDAPRERVDLRSARDSPAQARAIVAACTERLGLQDVRDDVTLVVSEMVTNAVRHAGPPVALEIQSERDAVLIAVNDGSPDRPLARVADADAEGGRGLLLIDLLCAEHGVRPDPPGKTVWAALRRSGP